MELVDRVARLIDKDGLLVPGDRCVVAVSGGADSLAMLHILSALAPGRGWQLVVATYDHRWRPDSAAANEVVRAEAARLGWPCEVGAAETPCHSEAGAREQRLAFLHEVVGRSGARRLALGHTADDRAETLLLNLVRGAGTTGLGAMPVQDGLLIRPLLEARRTEVRAYAAARGLPVVVDPSNAEVGFARNRLRIEVMPALERLRPGAARVLARAAATLGDEAQALGRYGEFLLQTARAPLPPLTTDLPALCLRGEVLGNLPAPERGLLLRAAYRQLRGELTDFGRREVASLEDLALGRSDAGVVKAGALQACRLGPDLFLLDESVAFASWLPRPFDPVGTALPEAGLRVRGAEPGGDWPGGLALRPRRAGDRLRVPGRGTRKVSDLLPELRIPRLVRGRVPLLVRDDQPIWLPGLEGEAGLPPLMVELTGPPGDGVELC